MHPRRNVNKTSIYALFRIDTIALYGHNKIRIPLRKDRRRLMNIRPSAAIRQNYNEISKLCRDTKEPVYLTKNGEGDLVVMDIESFSRREQLLRKNFWLWKRIVCMAAPGLIWIRWTSIWKPLSTRCDDGNISCDRFRARQTDAGGESALCRQGQQGQRA